MRLLAAKVLIMGKEYILERRPDELKLCKESDILVLMFKCETYPNCKFVEFLKFLERDESIRYRPLGEPKHSQRETRLSNIVLWGRKEVEDESMDR